MGVVNQGNKFKPKIKTGDQVIVITGKDKGRTGRVLKVKWVEKSPRVMQFKVLIEGINLVKKHRKANPQKGIEGGVQSVEAFLESSKVMLYDEASKRGSRVGYRFESDGKKVRYLKSSGSVV